MRGMPFNLQGKGAVEVAAAATGALWRTTAVHPSTNGSVALVKKEGIEPRSVLDHRRSPSPPTSTSTLSSSQGGGGGGGADSAGVAAVSDNSLRRWPPSQDKITSSATADEAAAGSGGSTANGDGRREEWASELQPIPAALEVGLLGGEKCGIGMMEDWESMLSEPAAAASPGHDQSFLKWIMGEVEDPSGLKQQSHFQLLPPPPAAAAMEFDSVTAVGPRLVDPVFGFEHLGGMESGLSATGVTPAPSCSASATPAGGFAAVNSNSGNTLHDSRIPAMLPFSGNLQGLNASTFGNTHNPNPIFSPPPASNLPHPLSVPPGMFFQEATVDEKPHLFNPNLILNQQQTQPPQNPSFFLPLSPYDHQQPPHHLLLPPQPKRHHPMTAPGFQISPGAPFPEPMKDPFFRRLQQAQQHQQGVEGLHALPYHNIQQMPLKPKVEVDDQQQQALVDQLFKAAGLIEARNFVSARGILARLNHQLYSPIGKPLLRSAFYCKEALQCIVTDSSNSVLPSTSPPLQQNPAAAAALATPLDVVLKLSAYKAFSEISPILQFANFTCTQAILEELNGCDHIHIIDFDIGVGGQWSSFMQELAQRRCATVAATPTLKITAFASLYSSHPVELSLTMENLSHFANGLNISFEINILSIDSFDPAKLLSMAHNDETIVVNLPVGLAYPSIPALLHLVKQLSPKIVVSVDHGCDRSELTFSSHFLHTLKSAAILLDSIDAASTNADLPNKIERYLLQPRIDGAILGRHRASDKALPWRTLFASAGFVSVSFSNFTETQAECLLKKLQLRGFQVEKRQQSLFLCWKLGELVSVSAWRC